MNILKAKKRTVLKVDYGNLEKVINDYFKENHGFKPEGRNSETYSFVAMEECGNDSEHSFDVNGEIEDYDQSELDEVIAAKDFYRAKYNNGLFLNYLCSKGLIEKGDYLINVCW